MTLPSTPPEEGNIMEQLREALAEVIAKAEEIGVGLFLTGGTAAALYSEKPVRPLSFDLDFMVRHGEIPGTTEALAGKFGVTFRRFVEKPLFKSTKGVGKSTNGCDLDFILDQHIVPDEGNPAVHIEAALHNTIIIYCQRKTLNGVHVFVVPPEYVVLTKLFAGRGSERGKYDLTDVAAVIKNAANNGFNIALFLGLLQQFCPRDAQPAVKNQIKARLCAKIDEVARPEYGITETEHPLLQALKTGVATLPL